MTTKVLMKNKIFKKDYNKKNDFKKQSENIIVNKFIDYTWEFFI